MEVPSESRPRDGQRYQGRNRREHLIHFPAYGWWQPVRDMQIKRGESDRQAGAILGIGDTSLFCFMHLVLLAEFGGKGER